MDHVLILLQVHGLVIVFAAVLIERVGLPVPAFPVMLVAAAVAQPTDHLNILLLATGAALPVDIAWYWAGRRYGTRILSTLCRISISPDSCVSQTRSVFARWGSASLLVSSFVPGIATMAPPLAGAFGKRFAIFAVCDLAGIVLWSGAAVGLGILFRDAVNDVLETLETAGGFGLLLLAAAFALFLGHKLRQRQRLIRELRMERISVEELEELFRVGEVPTIIDARPGELRDRQGAIPGAIGYTESALDSLAGSLLAVSEVIVYCACPNEASAARIARELMKRGVRRVRPLRGGIDAWSARSTEVRAVLPRLA
jgi:membrane protein DedA with SNARE-associated domain/rhodanese-related sulfurtransferase